MRVAAIAAVVLALTSPAAAVDACPMEHAVYGDGELGYELRFRPAKPWETVGMVTQVYELELPDGRQLWGSLGSNMGTSRDVGSLFFGCPRPGPDDGLLDDAAIEACQVWQNVVYALEDGRIGFVPGPGEPAPPDLILADLGRKLRYSVLSGPGEEPFDQFTRTGCDRP